MPLIRWLVTSVTLTLALASQFAPAQESECATFADCADQNGDGKRDDPCLWYECTDGVCTSQPRGFGSGGQYGQADIGGPFGDCEPDGVADSHDRFHALNCFSNTNFSSPGTYPCEPNIPIGINVDGGDSASCPLDGVCDGQDAWHALNSFENDFFGLPGGYQCTCPPSPAPAPPPVEPDEYTSLLVRAPQSARPGELVEVDLHLKNDLKAFRGYQLHLGASGGETGALELIDIHVDADRRDYAYGNAPQAWSAFNRSIGQMVVGLDARGGAPVRGGAYLATYVYRVPADASGTFLVDVLYDPQRESLEQRTFLFGYAARPVGITATTPARIEVSNSKADARLGRAKTRRSVR